MTLEERAKIANEWASEEEGQKIINEALELAHKTSEELRKARHVDPKTLRDFFL